MNALTPFLVSALALAAGLGVGGLAGAFLIGFAAASSVAGIFWKQGGGSELAILTVLSFLILTAELPAALFWLLLAGVGSTLMADGWHGIPRWMRALSWSAAIGLAASLATSGSLLSVLVAALGGAVAGAAMLTLHERSPHRESTLRTGNLSPR